MAGKKTGKRICKYPGGQVSKTKHWEELHGSTGQHVSTPSTQSTFWPSWPLLPVTCTNSPTHLHTHNVSRGSGKMYCYSNWSLWRLVISSSACCSNSSLFHSANYCLGPLPKLEGPLITADYLWMVLWASLGLFQSCFQFSDKTFHMLWLVVRWQNLNLVHTFYPHPSTCPTWQFTTC